MIRNLIGAKLGAELAKKSSNVGTGRGAALGALAPLAIARLSLPALVVVGAGGYLLKRYRDGSRARLRRLIQSQRPRQVQCAPR